MSQQETSRVRRAVDTVHRGVLELLFERLESPRLGQAYSGISSHVLPRVVSITVGETTASFRVTNGIEYARVAGYENTPDFGVLAELLSNLQADDVFWDVGANVGIHTRFATDPIDTGEVVAFEPNPKNARRIRENLALDDRSAEVVTWALSSADGTTDLRVNTVDATGAFGQLVEGGQPTGVEVETKTGDGLVAAGELPEPSVVKVDVQGTEFDVLRGMKRCLASSECRLLYCNVYQKHFDTPDQDRRLHRFLDELDFEVSRIDEWEGGYFLRARNGSDGP